LDVEVRVEEPVVAEQPRAVGRAGERQGRHVGLLRSAPVDRQPQLQRRAEVDAVRTVRQRRRRGLLRWRDARCGDQCQCRSQDREARGTRAPPSSCLHHFPPVSRTPPPAPGGRRPRAGPRPARYRTRLSTSTNLHPKCRSALLDPWLIRTVPTTRTTPSTTPPGTRSV